MTRKQVQFLLGSPVIQDAFHADRWDYVYYTGPAGSRPQPRRLTLHFDADVLVRIIDAYSGDRAGEGPAEAGGAGSG